MFLDLLLSSKAIYSLDIHKRPDPLPIYQTLDYRNLEIACTSGPLFKHPERGSKTKPTKKSSEG